MSAISGRLAAYVAETRYEDLPEAAVTGAKRSLLDAIGVSLGASGLGEGVSAFVEIALKSSADGPCDIFGEEKRVSAGAAAFANGAMAHALDFEDALDGAPLHPNAALTPAVLALAQARGGVSGRELLTALAVGCDVAGRVAMSLRTPMEQGGWYPPPILGGLGAAAGAAKILHLNARQVLDTVSLMLCQSACSGEIKHAPDSVIRAVRDAFPAQAAVHAATLAAAGVRGFDAPFEGENGFFRLFAGGNYDAGQLLADLGVHFWGASLSYKPWPSCRGTHAFIEAALDLRNAVDPHQITAIALRGHPVQSMLAAPIESKRAPATAIDAKFSLPFTTALAFLRGNVTLDDFNPAALADASVLDLARRVSFAVDPAIASPVAGAMAVHLRDGSMIERSVTIPRGAPQAPLSWAELVAKAAQCAAHAKTPLPASRFAELFSVIATLENQADAAAALFGALRPPAPLSQ